MRPKARKRLTNNEMHYLLMLLPGFALLILFRFVPMAGIVMAFQRFLPARGIFGSKWVGLMNFEYMFQLPDIARILRNTVILSTSNIALGIIVPVLFALLLNEVRSAPFKRTVQTLVYLPHFLSWVILGATVKQLLAGDGIVNGLVSVLGGERIMFLANNTWFRPMLITTNLWKGFGFGTIIYLAAIANISPELYESAIIDGATRMQKIRYITLPLMRPTIVLMVTLSLGSVLDGGFDQVFNLYNPLVYETGDILDTYVYRIGLVDAQYGLATAVGLLKSVVSLVLITTSYSLARRFAGYKIF